MSSGITVVQVQINESTDRVITGTYIFDRDNGGILVIGSGSAFPVSPQPGEIFWRTDLQALYRRNDANDEWQLTNALITIPGQQAGSLTYFDGYAWTALPPGADGYVLASGGSLTPEWIDISGLGAGDVVGPSSATSGAVALYDGISGKLIQNSVVTIDGTGNISGATIDGYDLSQIFSGSRGSILYRGASGWTQLPPSTDGYALKTHGAGADPTWELVGDVTGPASSTDNSIVRFDQATGKLIKGSSATIDNSGNLSLPGNIDGYNLKTIFNGAQGSVIYRGASEWLSLAPGSDGYALKTHGAGANPTWEFAPTTLEGLSDVQGTVITDGYYLRANGSYWTASNFTNDVNANTNVAGALLTSGTRNMSADLNLGGFSLTNVNLVDGYNLQSVFSGVQGSVLYRNASGWTQLAPSTDGYLLTTHGAGQNPTWTLPSIPSNLGDLDNVSNGTPLDGYYLRGNGSTWSISNFNTDVGLNPVVAGAMLTDGTRNMAADLNIGGFNITNVGTVDGYNLQSIFSGVQGSILYRGVAGWTQLAPSTDGFLLSTHGAGADPTWVSPTAGSGDVVGPASSTNYALARFNGLTGKIIQNSNATLDDSGNLSLVGTIDGYNLKTIFSGVQGSILYRNNTGWTQLSPGTDGYILTAGGPAANPSWESHDTLRKLIHLADRGPFEGFASGAYKETLPVADPFPTSIVWYSNSGKTQKIVEKTIAYDLSKNPTTITWEAYESDGITVIATVTDTVSYSGVFETSRTRAIS